MIAVFPTLHPDELVFSCLSRYAVQSGYLTYRAATEDLFVKKAEQPTMEFMNRLKDDALAHLTAEKSFSDVIKHHTLTDYYIRFAPKSKRTKTYKALKDNNGGGVDSRKKSVRHLQYCPICATEDREKYGETYWHLSHQYQEINVCAKHGCLLHDSIYLIQNRQTPAWLPAESIVPFKAEPTSQGNEREITLAKYISNVMAIPINHSTAAGAFLRYRMEGTQYITGGGRERKLALFWDDFLKYYEGVDLHGFTELWQLSKTLCGSRCNTFEICLIAMFLGIKPAELCSMRISAEYLETAFSRRSQVSYKAKTKGNLINWDAMDRELLPKTKDIIQSVLQKGKRISNRLIQRELGLRDKQLPHLTLCLFEITKYKETTEQYWARKIVELVRLSKLNQKTVTAGYLTHKLNLHRNQLCRAVPYLSCYCSEDEATAISELFE